MSDLRTIMQGASRCLYVCRPYDPAKHAHAGVMRMKCADCSQHVAVTAGVLADRRARARDARVDLAVVCDPCSNVAAELAGSAVYAMPSDEEIRRSAS